MAIITKVSAQKKAGRYNIFLDGTYAFSASEKTLAEFVLLKGKELTSEQIDQIKKFDQDAKATDLAARYLSYQPRTIFEIQQYLLKHQISNEAIQAAIGELSDLGYLDDRQYVKLFLKNNFRVGRDGPRSVTNKLKQKGIDSQIIEEELMEPTSSDWLEICQRLLKSLRHQIGKISERALKQKAITKLMAHGFDLAIAQAAVEAQDFAADEEEKLSALKKQGIKAYKKYRHYDKREREYKIKSYLFAHGFESSEIEAFLAGEVIDLTELSEY